MLLRRGCARAFWPFCLAGAAVAAAAPAWTLAQWLMNGGRAARLVREAAEADLSGGDARAAWRKALEADPRSALAGVHFGLALERAGAVAAAEQQLLAVERRNRLWLPRWTLAGFYLRQGRRAEAAQWGRRALERSYAEVRPALFDLFVRAGVDAAEWLDWCGRDTERLGSAIEYLAGAGRGQELGRAVRRMAGLAPGRAPQFWRDTLYGASARLLELDEAEAAAQAWNAVAGQRLLPFGRIGAGNLIGNPEFQSPLDGRAFNWRFTSLPGVSRSFDPDQGLARLSFDGSQPEQCELLAAAVWLEAGRRYRFSCQWRALELRPEGAGPAWGLRIGPHALGAAAQNGAGRWEEAAVETPPAPRSGAGRLALSLERRRGMVRAAGVVEVRAVRLRALD